jgi:hypothetical protein
MSPCPVMTINGDADVRIGQFTRSEESLHSRDPFAGFMTEHLCAINSETVYNRTDTRLNEVQDWLVLKGLLCWPVHLLQLDLPDPHER